MFAAQSAGLILPAPASLPTTCAWRIVIDALRRHAVRDRPARQPIFTTRSRDRWGFVLISRIFACECLPSWSGKQMQCHKIYFMTCASPRTPVPCGPVHPTHPYPCRWRVLHLPPRAHRRQGPATHPARPGEHFDVAQSRWPMLCRRDDGRALHVCKATRAEAPQQAIYEAPVGIRMTVVRTGPKRIDVVPLDDPGHRNPMICILIIS